MKSLEGKLTAEKAIEILSRHSYSQSNFYHSLIDAFFEELSDEDIEKVHAYFNTGLESTRPNNPNKYARLLAPHRYVEESNPAHQATHEANARFLSGLPPHPEKLLEQINECDGESIYITINEDK